MEERELVENLALETALSDHRVKALIKDKKEDYELQANCYTLHKLLFEEQGKGSGDYPLNWDGKLRGQVVFVYDDASIYTVHVDVTDEKVWYTSYIKWGELDTKTYEPGSTEPDEWVNIFNDGRAQNLIIRELADETVDHLREVWSVRSILPFNGSVISPPEN